MLLISEFKILFLVESWLNNEIESSTINVHYPYNVFRNDRNSNIGGGVCAIIHKSLKVVSIKKFSMSNIDILCLDISLSVSNSVRFICIYIPPKSSTQPNIMSDLCDLLANILITDLPVFLCGDFNLPQYSQVKKCNSSSILSNFANGQNLTQIVDFPTRGQNILDLIFVSNNFPKINVNQLPPLGKSDHHCIVATLEYNPKNHHTSQNNISRDFDFKKGNYLALNQYFNNISWNFLLSPHYKNDINSLYSDFLQTIYLGMEHFIPYFPTKNNVESYPGHITKLKKFKDLLFTKIDLPGNFLKYTETSKNLDRELSRYHRNLENKMLKSSGDIYKYVRRVHKKSPNIQEIESGGNTYSDSSEIAEMFLGHFSNIYSNAIPAQIVDIPDNLDPVFDHALIFLTNNKVFELLDNLPLKINSSPDKIPYYFLKKCSVSLAYPVGIILRKSFLLNLVPDIWKTAIIKPIPKAKSTNINDYRPISLTCSLSKIAEKCILSEVTSFVEHCNILPELQHGFRANKSVYTNLIEKFDDFTRAIDNNLNVDIIYYDISKAFDTIEHTRLLAKLKLIGLGPNIVSWIESFVGNRTFTVNINNSLSSSSPVFNRGVPQGSLLGPILFNLYMHDLVNNTQFPDLIIKAYADDHNAYIIYKTPPKDNPLQAFTDHFSKWCLTNGLSLSELKCKVLRLGKNNPGIKYTIGSADISPVEDYIRDLGLHYGTDLRFDNHINIKCRKAFARWFTMFRFFTTKDPKVYILLYKSYVRPLLEFSSYLLNSFPSYVTSLESVQRRITRMIFYRCFTPHYSDIPSYDNRLKRLKITSLKERFVLNDLVLFHKIHSGTIALPIRNKPSLFGHNYGTRRRNTRYIYQHVRTRLRQTSFLTRTPKLFSSLPENLTNLSHLVFRKELQKSDYLKQLLQL